jgi:hypothetical protein
VAPLVEKLNAPGRRPRVIQDCVQLIEEEVKRKGGLTGIAIKAAFATVKAVKPGFIPEAVDHMLDDFAARLDPFYQSHQQAGGRSFPDHLQGQSAQVADALLGITDDRARLAKNPLVKKSYEKLRPSAKKHVEEAVPGIARLIEKHTAE